MNGPSQLCGTSMNLNLFCAHKDIMQQFIHDSLLKPLTLCICRVVKDGYWWESTWKRPWLVTLSTCDWQKPSFFLPWHIELSYMKSSTRKIACSAPWCLTHCWTAVCFMLGKWVIYLSWGDWPYYGRPHSITVVMLEEAGCQAGNAKASVGFVHTGNWLLRRATGQNRWYCTDDSGF